MIKYQCTSGCGGAPIPASDNESNDVTDETCMQEYDLPPHSIGGRSGAWKVCVQVD